ncbi:cytochrome c-type biogenesis protein CcmH [Serratia aquatilis]|uniref:Cytochrome c-type biogenesis protein n=1 Tax=Serratia aquatilis TaxID=1737515 RepID=A0ABV6EE10_9GAMM
MTRITILLWWCLLAWPLRAQVVDTWAFSSPVVKEHALSVAAKIRCPQCQNQNLLESNAPVAITMRHEVFAMTEQGKTESEIMSFMTARYGNFVRYQPELAASTLILWGLPPLMLALIGFVLWRSRSKP